MRNGFVGDTYQIQTPKGEALEEPKGSKRIATTFAILVAALIMTASFLTIAMSAPEDEDTPASISYSKRGIINIVGDIGFTLANGVTSGTGVSSDPYMITGYEIDASPGHAISITGTRAYFEVSGCYLHNGTGNAWDGIILNNVENGTVRGNVIQNNSHGIHLDASHQNYLFMNNVSLNSLDGIYLDECHNDTIDNNTCWKNLWNGVFLSISYNNTLRNNTCNHNQWTGIYLEASSNNTIDWNNCIINTINGIGMFWKCDHNVVFQNIVLNNTNYGCAISSNCVGNLIHDNTFIGNNGSGTVWNPLKIQGYDDTGPNSWSLSGAGNYWNDWTTPDNLPPGSPDGIVDLPYLLNGGAGVTDGFPLTTMTVIPEPGILFLAITMMAACLLIMRRRHTD